MTDKKNGSRRVGAGSERRATSAAKRRGVSEAVAVDVERIIKGTCRGFARAADWRQVPHVTPQAGYRLSENHEGLHSGRYISVSVLRTANALAINGGYYDGYRQPRTVYRESVPLRELTAQALSCLLMEMHDRLCGVDWEQST